MEIAVQNIQEREVAYVSFKGNYIGNAEVFASLFKKLGDWAGPKQLFGPDTIFLSSYQDDPLATPPEELTLDVCMTIPENTEVEGEIQKKVLPGGQYAVLHTEVATPEEYGPAWNNVVEWAANNGFEVDMTRPSYELYLNNPEEHPQKHHIIDICLSVKKA